MPSEDDPLRSRLTQARAGDGRRGNPTGREPSTEDLLRRYRRRRAVALRNQILERCRPMVESMARSLVLRLPRSVDLGDLVHAGMWGLMQAIDKYRHERCDRFQVFMRIRVRGAMLDELRRMDFMPRQQRRRLRERSEAMQRLRQELAREPSDSELAAELGVSHEVLMQGYAERAMQRVFDEPLADSDELSDTMDRLADDGLESPIEAMDRRELLAKIRQSLRPIEWKVLQMHYLEGLSGKEVARRLRLSASRICQIHVRVMDRLKARLRSVPV